MGSRSTRTSRSRPPTDRQFPHDPGCRQAFFGLVAAGWDLADFGAPWPRGPLPLEALATEVVVGCFDTQRAAREPLTAVQCNAVASDYFSARGVESPVRMTNEDLVRVRDLLAGHVWQWHATLPGETLTLEFVVAT